LTLAPDKDISTGTQPEIVSRPVLPCWSMRDEDKIEARKAFHDAAVVLNS